jgi:hypothetical protein
MKRSLVLALLCSVAFSYAQVPETEEQKAACDSVIHMIEAMKGMIPRQTAIYYSKRADEKYDALTQGVPREISELNSLERIYLQGREAQVCYERLFESVAIDVDYWRCKGTCASEKAYEKLKEVFVKAMSQKDNLSVECLKRIQEAFAKED